MDPAYVLGFGAVKSGPGSRLTKHGPRLGTYAAAPTARSVSHEASPLRDAAAPTLAVTVLARVEIMQGSRARRNCACPTVRLADMPCEDKHGGDTIL